MKPVDWLLKRLGLGKGGPVGSEKTLTDIGDAKIQMPAFDTSKLEAELSKAGAFFAQVQKDIGGPWSVREPETAPALSLPKELGVFQLNGRSVRVVARAEGGGSFWFSPPEKLLGVEEYSAAGDLPKIEIGLDNPWPRVVATLLHEAAEFLACDFRARFLRTGAWSGNGDFVFMFSHAEFTEMKCCEADFAVAVMEKLKNAYEDYWDLERGDS